MNLGEKRNVVKAIFCICKMQSWHISALPEYKHSSRFSWEIFIFFQHLMLVKNKTKYKNTEWTERSQGTARAGFLAYWGTTARLFGEAVLWVSWKLRQHITPSQQCITGGKRTSPPSLRMMTKVMVTTATEASVKSYFHIIVPRRLWLE